MNPIDFFKTVYLGDRQCKQLIIDGVASEVRLQIDLISRVRGNHWDYYADEDISNGFLVFEGVTKFELMPQGPLPNDRIDIVSVSETTVKGLYRFEFSLDAISAEHDDEVTLTVIATAFCLADAAGQKIRA